MTTKGDKLIAMFKAGRMRQLLQQCDTVESQQIVTCHITTKDSVKTPC